MSADELQGPWPLDAWERERVNLGRCPWSGDSLVRRVYTDGPPDAAGQVFSCAVCDCWGFVRG